MLSGHKKVLGGVQTSFERLRYKQKLLTLWSEGDRMEGNMSLIYRTIYYVRAGMFNNTPFNLWVAFLLGF